VYLFVEKSQKEARKDKVNEHRIMTKKERKEAEKVLSDDILSQLYGKRERTPSMVSNARDQKKSANVANNIFTELDTDIATDNANDADEADDDPEIKKERELKKMNKVMRKNVSQYIDKFTSPNKIKYSRKDLKDGIKREFKQQVDIRKGEGYFDDNVPKFGRGGVAKNNYKAYKAELKGWLDGVFI
jgi:hypothetical protein